MMRLAILTSGGDSPGTNAAIEAVVRHARQEGAEVLGIRHGFAGLAAGDLSPLTVSDVDGIGARGGTVLGTSRDRTVGEAEGRERIATTLRRERIDGLVLLGGDGSIRHGGRSLNDMGVACVAIPCTIDNDVPETDRSLGFDTACNRAIALADGIRDTAQALPGRMFVLETLGGQTGHIALAVAETVYADLVLLPEFPLDLDYGAARMAAAVASRGYALAVASEGAGDVHAMTAYLAEAAGHRARLTTIGHAQRGGPPSYLDRRLAAEFGALAVERLLAGETGLMTACSGYHVHTVDLGWVAAGQKSPDAAAYRRLNGMEVAD
ncbi:MAG: ATP-dependent 6-phosphofructokinase [Anaerolineae bacterium]|nr:ATP-dependent 6-phosphofructokinase [Anaerolineae bacterium]